MNVIQNKISYFLGLGNFKLIRVFQNILFHSFSAKLKCVQQCFDIINDGKSEMILIQDKEKLNLAINLEIPYISYFDVSFFVLKKGGLSRYFKFPNIYSLCSTELITLGILPLNNLVAPKFSFNFRPFRNSKELFFEIKKTLSNKNLLTSLSFVNFKFDLDFSSNGWLLKNFPLEKRILKNSLKFSSYSEANFTSNLSYYFINFLLNGLLWTCKASVR